MSASARVEALKALSALRRGKPVKDGFNHLRPRERSLANHLFKGTLRFRALLDSMIQRESKRKLSDIDFEVLDVLRLSSFDLLFSRTPAYATINEAVEITKKRNPKSKGFVNAILRKISGRSIPSEFKLDMLLPKELTQKWGSILSPEEIQKTVQNLANAPTISIRMNSVFDTDETQAMLKSADIPFTPSPFIANALRIQTGSIASSKAFKEGRIYIQNEASQIPALLLRPQEGDAILDLCAAPGGKTTQLSALAKGKARILAVDRSKDGLQRLKENADRLRCSGIEAREIDLLRRPEKLSGVFDKILLDAPCSAWGTLSSHPEWRWAKSQTDPVEFARNQLLLLETALKHLKDDGHLVYSVCTFSKEETVDVVGKFLESHPKIRLEDPRDNLPTSLHSFVRNDVIQIGLDQPPLDGFFIATFSHGSS